MSKLVLTLADGTEKTFDLEDEVVTVGRLPENHIPLDDGSVSSRHAKLTRRGPDYFLNDLSSTNGTRLNGENVTEGLLEDGDRVRFGKIEGRYEGTSAAGDRPLPEAGNPEAKVAEASAVPTNFSNASSFKTKEKKKDPAGVALIGFSVLSILAFAAALVSVFLLSPPQ